MFCSWEFALSSSILVLFVSVVASTGINRRHYFQSDLHISNYTYTCTHSAHLSFRGKKKQTKYAFWLEQYQHCLSCKKGHLIAKSNTLCLVLKLNQMKKFLVIQSPNLNLAFFLKKMDGCQHFDSAGPGDRQNQNWAEQEAQGHEESKLIWRSWASEILAVIPSLSVPK